MAGLELGRVRTEDHANGIASKSLADLVGRGIARYAGISKSTALVRVKGKRFRLNEDSSLEVDRLGIVVAVLHALESLSRDRGSCNVVRSVMRVGAGRGGRVSENSTEVGRFEERRIREKLSIKPPQSSDKMLYLQGFVCIGGWCWAFELHSEIVRRSRSGAP